MMEPSDLTIALDAINDSTKLTALHLSQDVAFKTAQFMMDALLQIRCLDQHQNVQDQHPSPDATLDEARFIKHMERLTRAFVSQNGESFHGTFQTLSALLSEHNLSIFSFRLSEIVHLWSSEKPEMDRHKKSPGRLQRRAIVSSFAERQTMSKDLAHETRRRPTRKSHTEPQTDEWEDEDENENEKSTDQGKDKGKAKMPAINTCSAPQPQVDNSIDVAQYPRSDAFTRYCQKPLQEYDAAGPAPSDEDEDSDDEGWNDWAKDDPDGVLVGRPPPYPVGLLDWNNKDTGKHVTEVAPDSMTRAKTVAASAAKSVANTVANTTNYAAAAAQGALQGIIGRGGGDNDDGGGAGVGGGRKKKGKMKGKKGKKTSLLKKGKFAKTPKEQTAPEHRYDSRDSDSFDSSDGSDWVTL